MSSGTPNPNQGAHKCPFSAKSPSRSIRTARIQEITAEVPPVQDNKSIDQGTVEQALREDMEIAADDGTIVKKEVATGTASAERAMRKSNKVSQALKATTSSMNKSNITKQNEPRRKRTQTLRRSPSFWVNPNTYPNLTPMENEKLIEGLLCGKRTGHK